MRIMRIEIEGSAGRSTIERPAGSTTIRIDSIVRDPQPGGQAWMTWELPARIDKGELFHVAEVIQERCEGRPGTNSVIDLQYYRVLQRFAD